jgi:hypothetical protein
MASSELHTVASAVLRLAQKQGHVVPRDIRDELARAGLDDSRWNEVVELLRESLHYRQGRFHLIAAPGSPRLEEEQHKRQEVHDIVQNVLREQQAKTDRTERRSEERIPFSRHIRIQTEDHQELTVMSQDLSSAGIRFIANRSLLGRRIRVLLPHSNADEPPVTLVVRILWTTAAGDGLFENGGSFLELVTEDNRSAPVPPASP